ncbi:MAG: helix-turn-helix domain-containing protein [Candidatus Pacearchaeota archaeon]|jgi:sugar-specific transcriptional regulator TrmB
MKYKELEGIGLTNSEILVYTTLLKIGQSATGKIVSNAKISSGKIYEVLDKLIDKGLAGYILKNNVKHFSALNPEKLKEYIAKKKKEIQEKEKEVGKIIPELKKLGEKKKIILLKFLWVLVGLGMCFLMLRIQ